MEQNIQVAVRPASGTGQIPRKTAESASDGIVQRDGFLYFRMEDTVYSCPDSPEGKKLLEAAARGMRTEAKQDTGEQIWRDLLSGKADLSLLRKYGIQDPMPRCVILFQPVSGSGERFRHEMIPVEEADRVAGLENGGAALILNMKKRSPEEAFEYAAAVTETMENEAGVSCYAGIGRTAGSAADLSGSYLDALNAVKTGIRYKIPGRIFAWDRQRLEHLTDLIPAGDAEAFRRELIPPQAEKVLNEETLETVRVFFQNDLNLSTTARQLFIHRNTLLYRMEKVRKATGLDLRKFEDAAVFRIMMNIRAEEEQK